MFAKTNFARLLQVIEQEVDRDQREAGGEQAGTGIGPHCGPCWRTAPPVAQGVSTPRRTAPATWELSMASPDIP